MTDNWKGWQIVLASASPRRKELLEQIGIEPKICPSKKEESAETQNPGELVMELDRAKAEDIASACPEGTMVIGADTVVALDGRVMGKPADEQEAFRMLASLSGKTHQVYTGVALVLCLGEQKFHGSCFYEETQVEVYPMKPEEIRSYIATGEPMDKAGAYGIQGSFAAWIKGIRGDYTNVVGLPLGRLYHEMNHLVFPGEEEQEADIK